MFCILSVLVLVTVSKPVSSYIMLVQMVGLDVLVFPSECAQRIEKSLTNVNGRCNRQGNQGFILHDDVFTGCHRDEVTHPICFGYSVDDFLSKSGGRESASRRDGDYVLYVWCVCVRVCVGMCVSARACVCVSPEHDCV